MDDGMIENLEDVWRLDFNDLEFEKIIGKGAFGEVYKGTYFGTPVAIKRIFDDDDESLFYLEREINVLKGMRHPNIVQFIGICKHEKGLLIVTEYVSQGDLRKKLKDQSVPMSWRLRANIAHQIACSMAYLHSRSIIHRDLKSKNLLVDDNWKIKVCDFGFARTAQKASRPMTICGTNDWMAPELILGQPYSEKADVFSFGIVLCEIITRRKITTELQRSALDAFGLDVDKFLDLVPSDAPAELTSIALECCVYEADQRPTFKALVPRLAQLMKTVPDTGGSSAAGSSPAASPVSSPGSGRPAPAGRGAAGRGAGAGGAAGGAGWNRRPTAGQNLISQNAKAAVGGPSPGRGSPAVAPKQTPVKAASPPKVAPVAGRGASPKNSFNNNNNKPTTTTSPNNTNYSSTNKASLTRSTPNPYTSAAASINNGTPGSPNTSARNSTRSRPPPRPMTLYGAAPVEDIVRQTSNEPQPAGSAGFFSYEVLRNNPPSSVDKSDLPAYLEPSEFQQVFGVSKDAFYNLPKWKQIAKKSEAGLF